MVAKYSKMILLLFVMEMMVEALLQRDKYRHHKRWLKINHPNRDDSSLTDSDTNSATQRTGTTGLNLMVNQYKPAVISGKTGSKNKYRQTGLNPVMANGNQRTNRLQTRQTGVNLDVKQFRAGQTGSTKNRFNRNDGHISTQYKTEVVLDKSPSRPSGSSRFNGQNQIGNNDQTAQHVSNANMALSSQLTNNQRETSRVSQQTRQKTVTTIKNLQVPSRKFTNDQQGTSGVLPQTSQMKSGTTIQNLQVPPQKFTNDQQGTSGVPPQTSQIKSGATLQNLQVPSQKFTNDQQGTSGVPPQTGHKSGTTIQNPLLASRKFTNDQQGTSGVAPQTGHKSGTTIQNPLAATQLNITKNQQGSHGNVMTGINDGITSVNDIQNMKMQDCNSNAATMTFCENNAKIANDDDNKDLNFFKKCITNFYCYKKSPSDDALIELPTYNQLIGTSLFNAIAKRVEMFFVRKTLWSQIIADLNNCNKLLDVMAARHLYMLYVLNILHENEVFERCAPGQAGKLYVYPNYGSCFVPPDMPVTCYSDFEMSLSGANSGKLTALFNQFFRETVSTDPIVPGFGKSPEEVFNANVHAFGLENALPSIFSGLTAEQISQITAVNADMTHKLEEVVSAVFKMKRYNNVYQNELLNDGGVNFINWNAELQKLQDAVESLQNSDEFKNTIGFRYQQDISFNMISGAIEASGKTGLAATMLAQAAIAMLFAPDAYHTQGSIRHVVGSNQQIMAVQSQSYELHDYWSSMLENWASCVKIYKHRCTTINHVTCIIAMSKYLYRTLDAMNRLWNMIPTKTEIVGTLPAKNLMFYILENIKKKGVGQLDASTTDDLYNNFFTTFGCNTHKPLQVLTQACMDSINNEIRKYMRQLVKI